MKEVIRLGGFILLFIGTSGLLISEFVLNWGRTVTLTLAMVNLVGLITLAVTHWCWKS